MLEKIKYVIKRDGKRVDFDERKIAIAIFKAAEATEGSNMRLANAEEVARTVTYQLLKEDIQTPNIELIQDYVERALMDSGFDDVAKNYILYRQKREWARDSNSSFMKQMKEIVKSEADEADVKRENANVNGDTAMGTMLQCGSMAKKEFATRFLMKPEHAKAHKNGDIHIHDMDFYDCTTTCTQIPLNRLFERGFNTGHGHLRTPQTISSYAALTAIALQSNQNEQHGGQAIPLFDFYLAPGVAKSYKKYYKKHLIEGIEDYYDLDDATAIIEDVLQNIGEDAKLSQNEETFDKKVFDGIFAKMHSSDNIENDNKLMAVIKKARKRADKDTDKETYQAMESFIHNLNTMHSRAGAQVPFTSINYGMDTSPEGRMVCKNVMLAQEAGLGNGETPIFPIAIFQVKEGVNYNPEDPNYDLFKLSMRVSAKRLFPNYVFVDAPFNLQYYKPDDIESIIATMGCRTRVISDVHGKDTPVGRGNLSFTSINLPRLGLEHGILGPNHKYDKEGFFKDLDKMIDLCIDQLLDRYKIQCSKKVKNFPFLMGQGVWTDAEKLDWNDTIEDILKHGTLTVGFIGLAETLKALTGEHHGESEDAQKLGLEIVGHMRDRMDEATKKYNLNFSLIGTPAEGLSGRFVRIDAKKYGIIEGVTDRDYYTNSNHIPVYYPISASKKIALEAPYHNLENGGHITYIEMDGDPTKNLPAFEKVIRLMKEDGVGYGSINHPVDTCPACGYTGIINDECPNCGKKEDEYFHFDRIRRITGYLVGTLDRFNNAKRAEEHDRVKHGVDINKRQD